MKTVNFKLEFDNPIEVFDLTATFLNEEISVLRAYSERVGQLLESKVIKSGYAAKVEISTDGSVKTEHIDPEYVNSFIHQLRPLILSRGPFSFEKICGMMGRKFDSPG